MKTNGETMFVWVMVPLVTWFFLWFFFGMNFLHNAIMLSAPPGDVGSLAMPIYTTLEMLFGRYYLHIFIFLFSIVFWSGAMQAIFTLGENLSILLKAGPTTLVIQCFVSGYEIVMILKRHMDIPTDMEGNMLNVVGQVWIYPVDWFGINMTLVGMGFLALLAICILSHYLFNYDLYGKKLAPVVHKVDHTLKKKLPTRPLLTKVEEVGSVVRGYIQQHRHRDLGRMNDNGEVISDVNTHYQTGGIDSDVEIPVLKDIVKPSPKPVTHLKRKESQGVHGNMTEAEVAVDKSVTTKLATVTSVSTTDKIRDGLITLGLGFDNLRLTDGPFTWRFSMTPATASIGQDKIWKEAEKELARLMQVNKADVSFDTSGGEYVYSINKPPQLRSVVLFKDLVRGRIQVLEDGIKFPLLLGIDTEGKPVQKCAFGLQDLLIVGKKGSGKSSLLHSMLIYQMLWSIKSATPVAYYISDVNGATAMKYIPLQGKFVQAIANSQLESVKMLEYLDKELKERVALLKKYKCQHITSVNEHLIKAGKPAKPIVFIVLEEVGALFSEKATRERLGSLIAGIVTTGRKYGMFFYSVGTFATKGMFGPTGSNAGKVLFELSTKMSFHLDSQKDATTFGGGHFPAEKLISVGDALLKQDTIVQRIHTPVFDTDFARNDAMIDKYIAFIASKI